MIKKRFSSLGGLKQTSALENDAVLSDQRFTLDIALSPKVSSMVLAFLPLVIQAHKGKNWRFLTNKIQQHLRANKKLHSSERRVVSEALFSIIRQFGRLIYLIEGPLHPASIWASYLLLEYHESYRPNEIKSRLVSIWPTGLDYFLLLDRLKYLLNKKREDFFSPQSLADFYSYPVWLVEKCLLQYGREKTIALLDAQNQRAPLTVRINTLKTTRENLIQELFGLGISCLPTQHSLVGLVLNTRNNVYALQPFLDGRMELQDEGSQLIGPLVMPLPGIKVLDACAGAGGKTLLLGAMMNNQGRLTALDIDERKLVELRKRVRRSGLSNVYAQTISEKGAISGCKPNSFDRVLCDVPCSGSGVFRRNPESKWQLTLKDLEFLPLKQLEILHRFASYVKPGGCLIYVTCSIFKEENEDVVELFLKQNQEFSLIPASTLLEVCKGNYLNLLPTLGGHDGFFAAVFSKQASV